LLDRSGAERPRVRRHPGGQLRGRTVLHRAGGRPASAARIETARSRLLDARPDASDRSRRQDHHGVERDDVLDLASRAAAERDDCRKLPSRSRLSCSIISGVPTEGAALVCRGARPVGYAADYAWLIDCCTRLGELTGEAAWTTEAVTIARQTAPSLQRRRARRLYTTATDAAPLVCDLVRRETGNRVSGLGRAVALARSDRWSATTSSPPRLSGSSTRQLGCGRCAVGVRRTAPRADLVEHGPVETVVSGDAQTLSARTDAFRAGEFSPGARPRSRRRWRRHGLAK